MQNNAFKPLIERHNDLLKRILSEQMISAPRLAQAIEYSLFPGGKRLRPLLVYLIGEMLGINESCLDIIAASIELTHCYSLIHDDLPAMDDDDFRRGQPSCHRQFDEATAILAGDGLQSMAVDVLLNQLPKYLAPQQVIEICKCLLKASGCQGMLSGQSLDLTLLNQPHVSEKQLNAIHQLKTGQLILACATMPLAACDPRPDLEKEIALKEFASLLGLAFQIQDDYLDAYGDQSLGKNRASDSANGKATYAALYTQTDLLAYVTVQYNKAVACLEVFGGRATKLHELTQKLSERCKD